MIRAVVVEEARGGGDLGSGKTEGKMEWLRVAVLGGLVGVSLLNGLGLGGLSDEFGLMGAIERDERRVAWL